MSSKKVRLPDNPNERILIRTVSPEYEILNRDVAGEGLFLLPIPFFEIEVENVRLPGRLGVNRTFALSPYSRDLYVDATDDLTVFALKRKGEILARVAQELGAKSVKFEGLRDMDTSKEIGLEASGPVFDRINVKAGGKKSLVNKMIAELQTDQIFTGGPINLDGALSVLRDNLQDKDETLLTLVEHRQTSGNELKRHEVALAVRNEMKDILQIGFKVQLDVLDLGIDFKKQQESTDRYAIKYTIEF
jgi:hypothetical protein